VKAFTRSMRTYMGRSIARWLHLVVEIAALFECERTLLLVSLRTDFALNYMSTAFQEPARDECLPILAGAMTSTIPPIRPGEVLFGEFLKPLSVTQHHVAVSIGVPPRRINEIVGSPLARRSAFRSTSGRTSASGSTSKRDMTSKLRKVTLVQSLTPSPLSRWCSGHLVNIRRGGRSRQ